MIDKRTLFIYQGQHGGVIVEARPRLNGYTNGGGNPARVEDMLEEALSNRYDVVLGQNPEGRHNPLPDEMSRGIAKIMARSRKTLES